MVINEQVEVAARIGDVPEEPVLKLFISRKGED